MLDRFLNPILGNMVDFSNSEDYSFTLIQGQSFTVHSRMILQIHQWVIHNSCTQMSCTICRCYVHGFGTANQCSFFIFPSENDYHIIEREFLGIEASVGDSIILEHVVNQPEASWLPHINECWKLGISTPIFRQHITNSPDIADSYDGRLDSTGGIQLRNIIARDAGWYRCATTFFGEMNITHTSWAYLSVNGKTFCQPQFFFKTALGSR